MRSESVVYRIIEGCLVDYYAGVDGDCADLNFSSSFYPKTTRSGVFYVRPYKLPLPIQM